MTYWKRSAAEMSVKQSGHQESSEFRMKTGTNVTKTYSEQGGSQVNVRNVGRNRDRLLDETFLNLRFVFNTSGVERYRLIYGLSVTEG